MTRFFLSGVEGDTVRLGPDDSRHLLKVMRAQPGETFTVLAAGVQYRCRLVGAENGLALGRVIESGPAAGEPPIHLTLVQGLARGEKMDEIIQHGTEVGVSAFIPVATSRAVIKLEPRKAAERVERWQRIAREAAEQCRRGAVPSVAPVAAWREVAARCSEYDLALVPWEEGGEPLRQVLANHADARRIAVFIGPEGGLSPEEVALARSNGALPVTLGPRILRTETAGLAAAVAILHRLGDLG